MERKIEVPMTTANLIASLLDSARRHFITNGKYISAYESEKAAEWLKEQVKKYGEK